MGTTILFIRELRTQKWLPGRVIPELDPEDQVGVGWAKRKGRRKSKGPEPRESLTCGKSQKWSAGLEFSFCFGGGVVGQEVSRR